MGDAPNELEVLEARREILQLEITLAQERRAAAEAEQKGKNVDYSWLLEHETYFGFNFGLCKR